MRIGWISITVYFNFVNQPFFCKPARFSHFEPFPGQKTRGHCQSLPFCQRIQGWGRYGKREGYDDGDEIVDDDADDDIVCLAIPC